MLGNAEKNRQIKLPAILLLDDQQLLCFLDIVDINGKINSSRKSSEILRSNVIL